MANMQIFGRAVSVPGRALAGVLALLRSSGLAPESHRMLLDYHAGVVALLTSQGMPPFYRLPAF